MDKAEALVPFLESMIASYKLYRLYFFFYFDPYYSSGRFHFAYLSYQLQLPIMRMVHARLVLYAVLKVLVSSIFLILGRRGLVSGKHRIKIFFFKFWHGSGLSMRYIYIKR